MNNININKNSNQSGRSMIEMLGVLAIVGVLSVGGIAGYSKAMMKFKINKTVDEISHIVANIRTLYAQQTSYEGLGTSTVAKMGIVPDSLPFNQVNAFTNAFNGRVEIHSMYENTSYDKLSKFRIVYEVPKEACIALATYDWGSESSSGLVAISAGSNGAPTGPNYEYTGNCNDDSSGSYLVACPNDPNNPTPMSVARAASACNCDSGMCAVGLMFR